MRAGSELKLDLELSADEVAAFIEDRTLKPASKTPDADQWEERHGLRSRGWLTWRVGPPEPDRFGQVRPRHSVGFGVKHRFGFPAVVVAVHLRNASLP